MIIADEDLADYPEDERTYSGTGQVLDLDHLLIHGQERAKCPFPCRSDLSIFPEGYGDFGSANGHGCPIFLEIYEGRLRLIVFADINDEDPTIIDLEAAREDRRTEVEHPLGRREQSINGDNRMLTLNAGATNEVALRVVLESEECGREYFDHCDSIDEMMEAVKRLVEDSADCAADDAIERLIGIAIVPKSEYGSESGYGFDLD